LTFTVPNGCYLILPSVGPQAPDNLPMSGWHNLTIVPAPAIQGRVLLRSYPLNRLQRIS
jgi:hypothetical protein